MHVGEFSLMWQNEKLVGLVAKLGQEKQVLLDQVHDLEDQLQELVLGDKSEDLFVELDDTALSTVRTYMRKNPDITVAENQMSTVLVSHLQSLQPATWLNSSVINFFCGMLERIVEQATWRGPKVKVRSTAHSGCLTRGRCGTRFSLPSWRTLGRRESSGGQEGSRFSTTTELCFPSTSTTRTGLRVPLTSRQERPSSWTL